MFPNIDPQQGLLALADGVILVGSGFNFQIAVLHNQPGPAAAEHFGCRIGELLFEP